MYYLMSLRMYFKLDVLGHGFNSSTQEDQKFESSLRCITMEFEACLCYVRRLSERQGVRI